MADEILQIVRGSDYGSLFTVRADDESPVDLTGATVEAFLRHPWHRKRALSQVEVAVLDAVTGACSIEIDSQNSALLGEGAVQELVISVVSSLGVAAIYTGALVEGL